MSRLAHLTYTRFPQPGTVPPGDEHYSCRVYFHRLGDDQAKDALVFERPDDREIVFATALTGDDRQLVIAAFKDASDTSEMFVLTSSPSLPSSISSSCWRSDRSRA